MIPVSTQIPINGIIMLYTYMIGNYECSFNISNLNVVSNLKFCFVRLASVSSDQSLSFFSFIRVMCV